MRRRRVYEGLGAFCRSTLQSDCHAQGNGGVVAELAPGGTTYRRLLPFGKGGMADAHRQGLH